MKPAAVSTATSRTLAEVRKVPATGDRAAEDIEVGTRAIPSGRLRKVTCRVRAPKLPCSLRELHPVGDRFRSPSCLGLPFLPRASSRCHAPGGQDSASRACRLAHVARTSLCLADSRQLTGLPTARHAIFWPTVRIFWPQRSNPEQPQLAVNRTVTGTFWLPLSVSQRTVPLTFVSETTSYDA